MTVSPLPPQAYIFRTSRLRSIELTLVLAIALFWSLHDVTRGLYHGILAFLPSLSTLPFTKNSRTRLSTFLSILPNGLVFSLLLPQGVPWFLSVFSAILLGQVLMLRPRVPVIPLLLGLLILAWPGALLPTDSPVARVYAEADGTRILDTLNASGITPSPENAEITDRVNNLLAPIGVSLPSGYTDIFFGRGATTLADFGWPFLLLGFIYLYARGYLNWQGPLGFLLLFLPGMVLLGGLVMGKGLGEGDAIFLLLSGGFMLPLLYCLSDYTLMPLGAKPRLVAGLFAGFLAVLGASVYPPAVPYGTLLVVWLAQRFFERIRVKEEYHQDDSMLFLWNGGR